MEFALKSKRQKNWAAFAPIGFVPIALVAILASTETSLAQEPSGVAAPSYPQNELRTPSTPLQSQSPIHAQSNVPPPAHLAPQTSQFSKLPINEATRPTSKPMAGQSTDEAADPVFRQKLQDDFEPVLQRGSLDFHILTNQQLKWILGSPRHHADQIGLAVPEPPRDDPTFPFAQQANFLSVLDDDEPNADADIGLVEESDEQLVIRMAETVEAEIEAAKNDTQLDDAARSERLNVLTKASDWFQKAKTYKRSFELFEREGGKFIDTLNAKREELKQVENAQPDAPLDPNTIQDFQNQIQTIQSEIDTQKTDLESLHNDLEQFTQRSAKIPSDKSDAQKRLSKVQDVDANGRDAAALLQISIRLASVAETKMLNVETRYLEMQSQLNPLKIDIANLEMKRKAVKLEELKRAAETARNLEIAEQQRLAQQAINDALNSHPELLEFAKRNQKLTEQRQTLAVDIEAMSEETATVGEQTKSVETELDSLRKQVKQGLAKENSLMIAEKRRQMISPLESRVRLGQIQKEIQRINLLQFQLQEERESLADPETVMTEQLAINVEHDHSNLQETATELIETRRKLLGDSLADYRSYKIDLVKTDTARKELLSGLSETQQLLNEHMMWVRSTDPVSLKTINTSSKGMLALVSTDKWNVLVDRLLERAQDRPYEYLMFVFGFVFLAGIVKRLRD